MITAVTLLACVVVGLTLELYDLKARVRAVEERNDALEDQVIYLETCLFTEAVVSEARHHDAAWQATEGRQS